MGQRQANLPVAQRRVARADSVLGGAVRRVGDVEDDVGQVRGEGLPGGHGDVLVGFQGGDGGGGELGDHVHVAVDQRLHPGVGVLVGLEDDLVDDGGALPVVLVGGQAHVLALPVLDQLEGARADHRRVVEGAAGPLCSQMCFGRMYMKTMRPSKLPVGTDLADGHRGGVGRLDHLVPVEVGGHVDAPVGAVPVQLQGVLHIRAGQRGAVVEGGALHQVHGPGEAVVGDRPVLGQLADVVAVEVEGDRGVVGQLVDGVVLGELPEARVEGAGGPSPPDADRAPLRLPWEPSVVVVVASSAPSSPQAARTITRPSSTASVRCFMSRPFPPWRGTTARRYPQTPRRAAMAACRLRPYSAARRDCQVRRSRPPPLPHIRCQSRNLSSRR